MLIARAVGARKMVISAPAFQKSQRQMIGRDSILAAVRGQLVNVIRNGASCFVLVTGDSGCGKTRFLQYLSNAEDFAGYKPKTHVFFGSGIRESSTIPYSPWRHVLEVCWRA